MLRVPDQRNEGQGYLGSHTLFFTLLKIPRTFRDDIYEKCVGNGCSRRGVVGGP
jgi:hypothetical protein